MASWNWERSTLADAVDAAKRNVRHAWQGDLGDFYPRAYAAMHPEVSLFIRTPYGMMQYGTGVLL